jgi:hypothetical protein
MQQMLEKAKYIKKCDAYHINSIPFYYINKANKEKYSSVASAVRVYLPGSRVEARFGHLLITMFST